jgi:hypothetical protein
MPPANAASAIDAAVAIVMVRNAATTIDVAVAI